MRKLLFGILAIAAVGTPATAADLAIKAPLESIPALPSWTGLYIGGNVGAAWRLSGTNELVAGLVGVGPEFSAMFANDI